MFNTMMKPHTYKKLQRAQNAYNEVIESYVAGAQVEMFISYMAHNDYNGNNQQILECDYMGLTYNNGLNKGDLIDEKLKVNFINKEVEPFIVYLKEVENDGGTDSRR